VYWTVMRGFGSFQLTRELADLCDSTVERGISGMRCDVKKLWLFASIAIGILAGSQTALAEGPIVWTVPSTLVRIARTEKAGTTKNVRISAARGEYQSFQVAVQATAENLTNLSFSVSNLVMAGNNRTESQVIPLKNILL